MSKYIHARTCVYNLNYHIVWCVKYRRKVLDEEISSRLYGIIQEIAQEKGFHVATCKVGDMDHVHCFLSAKPDVSISYMVKMLKGITARKLFMEFPELKLKLRKGVLWNHSYYVETIGSVSEENIRRYMEKQTNSY